MDIVLTLRVDLLNINVTVWEGGTSVMVSQDDEVGASIDLGMQRNFAGPLRDGIDFDLALRAKVDDKWVPIERRDGRIYLADTPGQNESPRDEA